MSDGPLVLLLLDSLAHAYVERGDAPYYSTLKQRGSYTDIDNLFAFDGVTAAVMTGRWPDETGVFARFAYGPDESVMRFNPLRVMNRIDRHAYFADGERRDGKQNFPLVKAVRKALRKWWYTGGVPNLSPYGRIPLALADRFRYSLILGEFDKTHEISGYQTIFARAARMGRKSTYIYGDLPQIQERLSQISDLPEYGIIFLHTWGKLDLGGHDFGPDSDELRNLTRMCDSELSSFLPWLEGRLTGASFVLFADHGMEPVHTTIDVADLVTEAIDESGALVFVDSVAVRAWGTDEQLSRFRKRLEPVKGVSLLTEDDLKRGHAWFPNGEYGDVYAAADPGYVFAPDFFCAYDKRLGMHGYFGDTFYQRPSLLWFGPGFEGLPADFAPANMTDVWKLASCALDGMEQSGS